MDLKYVIDSVCAVFEDPESVALYECDSPIEDVFLREFQKVANDEVRVWRQYEVETQIGRFRLDFMLESPSLGLKIGVECDGRDFHSADRDAKRDAAIVGTKIVDKVYRIRGRDIHFRIHDSLDLLAFCEPRLFSERGLVNMDTLSHPRRLREDWKGPWTMHFPWAAIRQYRMPSDEECIDADPDDFGPFRPTVIVWT